MRLKIARPENIYHFLSACLAALAIIGLSTVTAFAAKKTVTGQYSVTIASVPVATATVSIVFEGKYYSTKLNAITNAFASLFVDSKTNVLNKGIVSRGRVFPLSYNLDSKSDKINFKVDMSVSKRTVMSSVARPGLRKSTDRIKIQPHHVRGVVDPLSAVLFQQKTRSNPAGKSACRQYLKIFDGWTRFDVKFSYKKNRHYSVNGYTGPVAVCQARWIPIAGHRKSNPSVKELANNEKISIWLAPLGYGNLLVPVRISIGTKFGPLVVKAQQTSISLLVSQNLRLKISA